MKIFVKDNKEYLSLNVSKTTDEKTILSCSMPA
jgi:hypothetical protein